MDKKAIFEKVDHTLLTQTAVWEEIRQVCEEAVRFGTASVCIPPCYVAQAKEYVKDKMAVCTVVGFPNGYNTTAVKEFETREALKHGADEIDMVINLGWVKDKKFDCIEEEIRTLKGVCQEKILKVIIETCLLTEEEKIKMCQVVINAGADYIKTSTGFSKEGATAGDIRLFKKHSNGCVSWNEDFGCLDLSTAEGSKRELKIKAAGGITSFEDAERFIELGASRLGTSRVVKLEKKEQAGGY